MTLISKELMITTSIAYKKFFIPNIKQPINKIKLLIIKLIVPTLIFLYLLIIVANTFIPPAVKPNL